MILIEISKNFGLKSSCTFSKIYKIFYRRQMVDVKADSKAGTHNLCRKKPLVCMLYVYSFHDPGSDVFLIWHHSLFFEDFFVNFLAEGLLKKHWRFYFLLEILTTFLPITYTVSNWNQNRIIFYILAETFCSKNSDWRNKMAVEFVLP